MTKNPACCFDTTSLHDAAQMMADHDCGCIPVLDNDENKRPIGTITDRDITIRALAHGKNSLNMVVGEIMTDNPVTIGEDASFDECVSTMEKNQIRRILVVDKTGECTGIVAQADFARKAGCEHETAELVKEVSAGGAAG
ncbi:MAG TPA: CBS domain-containing protein [Pyrinomonadaceae bacterium]|nr:CBS domain-containing protein [Pyrinomonadaceae bacterium]